ncbi:MAG: hypothetical protein ACRDD9_14125 [Shewanella sp.]
MKFFTALVFTLFLLSPAAQGETTFYGLTLGKSTLHEVTKIYSLHYMGGQPGAPYKSYYNVSGIQFNEPQLKDATFYFDENQILEATQFNFQPSVQNYKDLKAQLSSQYPRIEIEPFISDPFGIIDKVEFRNDTTHVSLTYDYHWILLAFTNL